MNPNVTNTVPVTQEEGALRIVPEQQQSSPDVTHSAATTVKLLPKVHFGIMKYATKPMQASESPSGAWRNRM